MAGLFGVHRDARIAAEKTLKKLHGELTPIEKGIADERRLAVEMEQAAAKLAVDAINDRKKLTEQTAFYTKQAEHLRQSENLERLAAPIRASIAAAESEMPRLVLAETIETVRDAVRELPAMAAKLAELVQPIAKAFGEFRARLDAATAKALPLIAADDDQDRISHLADRLRTMVVKGVRQQLAFSFRAEGLDGVILDASQFDGKDFQSVSEPILSMLIDALEVNMYTGLSTPGRGTFVCKTNVSNLCGLRLRANEVISLPLEHEHVRKMVEAGALEKVTEAA
jgi:hypothetical protein